MDESWDALLTRHRTEKSQHDASKSKLPKKKRWEIPMLDEALDTRHKEEKAQWKRLHGDGGGGGGEQEGNSAGAQQGDEEDDDDDLLARIAKRAEVLHREQSEMSFQRAGAPND